MIPEGSPLVGTKPLEASLFSRHDRRLLDVIRDNESLRRELDEVTLRAGDRIILKTPVAEVMSLREESAVAFHDAHALEPVGQPPHRRGGRASCAGKPHAQQDAAAPASTPTLWRLSVGDAQARRQHWRQARSRALARW